MSKRMKSLAKTLKNPVITVTVMIGAVALGLAMYYWLRTESLIPAVFVLGVLLVSLFTDSYVYSIVAAFVSVLAMNYAFTFPYFKLDFVIHENLVSAVIMAAVTLVSSALTTRMKRYEAVKAESQREKMRANLLRAISHDLRTPLTTIYGSSSALLENQDGFSAEQREQMLRGIREDAAWLVRMVENLLSVTRIEDGNVRIIKTPTVLDELIDSVIHKFKKQYPQQPVELHIPSELTVVPMDAILIEQVIINLLDNAAQHAAGMTRLTLKVFSIGKKVVFEIADDGCGIAEDKLKNIFTGLYTTSQSSDSHKRNAGIGLSVCATIIKAHGGDIKAENAKGGGAIFRFTLDLAEGYDEQ